VDFEAEERKASIGHGKRKIKSVLRRKRRKIKEIAAMERAAKKEAAMKAFWTKLVSNEGSCIERFHIVLADPKAMQKEETSTFRGVLERLLLMLGAPQDTHIYAKMDWLRHQHTSQHISYDDLVVDEFAMLGLSYLSSAEVYRIVHGGDFISDPATDSDDSADLPSPLRGQGTAIPLSDNSRETESDSSIMELTEES
jgi:hypothetical protein